MLVEGIQHLDVESRRFVEAVNRVIKQDVCVLEEPGCQYEAERDAHETGLGGDGEKYGEDDYYACRAAAGWAEEVGDDGGVWVHDFQERYCDLLRSLG